MSCIPVGHRSKHRRITKILLLALGVAVVLFWSFLFSRSPAVSTGGAPPSDATRNAQSAALHVSRQRIRPTAAEVTSSENQGARLTPRAMQLEKKILVIKKWNGGEDSFGLDKPPAGQEGATVGPSSVAYVQGKLCVLDNVNKRILLYDRRGTLISSVPLSTKTATDLAVDTTGSELLVIDHYQNKVYKVNGNETTLFASVAIRDDLPIGTKFGFDPLANTLITQEVHQDGLADIDGNNLILSPNTDRALTVGFDRPVACVEEVVTDSNGIMWVLFTLEGDFQMRRVARIDPANGSVGTAEMDVWFPFDATRHMVATGDGVVLFAGDADTGRLISFDYGGTGL